MQLSIKGKTRKATKSAIALVYLVVLLMCCDQTIIFKEKIVLS